MPETNKTAGAAIAGFDAAPCSRWIMLLTLINAWIQDQDK